MIQIGDVVVSLDVFQEKFLCDLGACKGACCIEGDAGAPVELDEVMELEEVLPVIWDELASEARAVPHFALKKREARRFLMTNDKLWYNASMSCLVCAMKRRLNHGNDKETILRFG